MKRIRFAILRVLLMVPLALGAFSARVGLSALFTSIKGRYGGGVFRNWKGLHVLGVLPDSVHNPNSDKQVKARGILTCVSKEWELLTIAVKQNWETVSVYLTDQWDNYNNEVGSHAVIRTPRGPFTALGAMVSCHSLLSSCDAWDCEDALITAPDSTTAPAQPMNLSCSGDTDGIVCVWDDPASWGANSNPGYIRLWAKSENGKFFAQIAEIVAHSTETGTITELVPVGGVAAVSLDRGHYFIQCDAVNGEGFRSAPSAVFQLVIAAPV